jgi:hypothetical protein
VQKDIEIRGYRELHYRIKELNARSMMDQPTAAIHKKVIGYLTSYMSVESAIEGIKATRRHWQGWCSGIP